MMTSNTTKGLLIAALLSAMTALAPGRGMAASLDDDKELAKFKIGSLQCAVIDGQLRCTPARR